MTDIEETQTKTKSLLDTLPNTFSRRKRARSEHVDPLIYDSVPDKVRMQFLHLLDEALELDRFTQPNTNEETYKFLTDFMRLELGVAKLGPGFDSAEFRTWFRQHEGLDDILDAIELIFRVVSYQAERASYRDKTEQLEGIVEQLNARLMEAAVGFQFESGKLIEASSRYLHSEVVVPALHLLSDPKFAAANKEFLDAHEAFRDGDYEKTLVECCKSFESVIKVIAAERSWEIAPNATANALVKAVFDNDLIPEFLESEFTGIRTVLQSGVGTVRNKLGGHGAGTTVRVVPRRLAAFQLHQTGAAVTLLAEAHASV